MRPDLKELIERYVKDEDVYTYLESMSKPNLVSMLIDLLTIYVNDSNSSTIREFITVALAGYEHSKKKLGYNGYRQIVGAEAKEYCEAKPRNLITGQHKRRKLNGGGNFTDYTPKRLERDKAKSINILVSGFVDGKLVYILEFPFNCPQFLKSIEYKVSKWLAKRGQRNKGEYLRSLNFSYKDYKNCDRLRAVFVSNKLDEFKGYLEHGFYKFLKEFLQ